MGKAAKPRNDLLMPLGIIQVVLKHRTLRLGLFSNQLDEPRHGFVLHREVFAVCEYEVDEYALDGFELLIEARRQSLSHQRLGTQVAGKTFGGVAIDHPGKLI